MKKTILITGWTWYIWSHCVITFEKAWYKAIIVDNLCNSWLKTLDWIEKILWYKPNFFEIDLRDKVKLEELFKKYTFDWVIHFAWLKAVWESCNKSLEYFDNNIIWSLRLFELMQKYWVKNIIFSSSATVYDISQKSLLITKRTCTHTTSKGELVEQELWEKLWIDENFRTWNTTNPYWTTKFLLEQILNDLSKFAWFKVVSLRYFNPIWAHESWYIWEDPFGIPNNLLPYIMKVANWELKHLQVFWDDYDTVDGTWVRDYIDVVDLIDGHLKAWEKIEINWNQEKNNWFFEVYNLWVWKWVSVLEIIKEVEKVTWKKISYKIVERRPWDVAEMFCNPWKAFDKLWWKSKTSLNDSLKNSWKFYKKD